MQRNLKVTKILQASKSLDCGPTCVQMILKFYGVPSQSSDIRKLLKYNKDGTSMYDNALLLQKYGIRTKIVMADPRLFPPDVILIAEDMKDKLSVIDRKIKKLGRKKLGSLPSIKRYLESDGSLQVEIPTAEHIKKSIAQGNPVMALIFAQALGSKEGGMHFVVVTGYDSMNFFLNNPSPLSKLSKVPQKNFMYALHSSTLFDYDNGTLLLPSKN